MSKQLERYLRDVAVALHALPRERRENEIEEILAHLLAHAEKQQGAGAAEEEAMRAAINQFGTPAEVGRRITRSAHTPRLKALRLIAWCLLALAVFMANLLFEATMSDMQPSWLFVQSMGLALLATFTFGFCFGTAAGKGDWKWAGIFYATWGLVQSSVMIAYSHGSTQSGYFHWAVSDQLRDVLGDAIEALIMMAGAWAGSLIGAKAGAIRPNKRQSHVQPA